MVTPPVQPLRLSIACLLICLSSARVTAAQWSLDTPKDETLVVHGAVQDALGVNQQSVVLDGLSVIELKNSAALNAPEGSFTFSVWFNPYALNAGQQVIAGKNRYSRNERQWSLTLEPDGRLKAYLQQGGWATISSQEALEAGRWYLATLTVSAGKAALYLNGKAAASASTAGSASKTASTVSNSSAAAPTSSSARPPNTGAKP